MINATVIFQMQLAHSLGLDRYAEIMHENPESFDFQRKFNGYYRIRRNAEWKHHYYNLFQQAIKAHFSFEQIITELYQLTGNIEASFSSKMLATIDASKPIWDQYVLQNLGFKLFGKTKKEKLDTAIILYGKIEEWYSEYLPTAEARHNIKEFDRVLPQYTWVSDIKKIDCLLWSNRVRRLVVYSQIKEL